MSTQTITRQKYGFSKIVPFGYDRTIERVKEELKIVRKRRKRAEITYVRWTACGKAAGTVSCWCEQPPGDGLALRRARNEDAHPKRQMAWQKASSL